MKTTLRSAVRSDADAIARIYNHYIRTTVITFEEEDVPVPAMAARIDEVQDGGLPWIVAERNGELAGYAYASKWKGRCAYRYSVESTVYLDPAHVGQGAGTMLYEELLSRLRAKPMHAVMGGIALPNQASVALHERLGFRKVAHFSEVGFKFGRWIDVGYWQLLLGG